MAPIDPILGIYAAVTRRTLDGKHPDGWVPQEKISVEEALRAYTSGDAYGVFAERTRGRLAPGYKADLVLLDQDLTRIPPRPSSGPPCGPPWSAAVSYIRPNSSMLRQQPCDRPVLLSHLHPSRLP